MSDKNITVIDCGEVFGIAHVTEMYMRVLSLLAEGQFIQFDVSKIERIDTAAIQMIYAFSKEAERYGHSLNWEGASEAFVRSAKFLGLATRMNLTTNTI